MPDPFNLDRFVQAQEPVLAQVRRELGEARKRTHWMWFVFPQLSGLGHSAIARHAIAETFCGCPSSTPWASRIASA